MRVPDYYPQFTCIADRCVNSCCRAGWEIDLDDDTYARYMTVEGELGERLKKYIDNVEEDGEIFHVCHMQEGSCPFVNKRGLCDIVLALGEDALSVVCTEYPRYYVDCGPVTEVSLSLSCEEAARILYEKETPMTFMEIDDTPNVAGKVFDEEDEKYLMIPMDQFQEIRNNTISLLQDRSRHVTERLKNAFSYTEQVQEILNEAEDRLEEVSTGELSYVNL
ncbi:MAG: flagellin lysine-N-methylase, partial [Lachnospiraceae bacterium]|nr:flagellin lysine-N-methylase [Candidatus Equihabitans merdae]